MNPAIALALSNALAGIIEIWRIHDNKPPEWEPGPDDWATLRHRNARTAEDYEQMRQVAFKN